MISFRNMPSSNSTYIKLVNQIDRIAKIQSVLQKHIYDMYDIKNNDSCKKCVNYLDLLEHDLAQAKVCCNSVLRELKKKR